MLVDKTVKVTKEADELATAIVKLVKVAKAQLADGFQLGTDIPIILSSVLGDLIKGVDGMDKIGDEAKANLAPFINTWVLAGTEIAAEFLTKKEQEVLASNENIVTEEVVS